MSISEGPEIYLVEIIVANLINYDNYLILFYRKFDCIYLASVIENTKFRCKI